LTCLKPTYYNQTIMALKIISAANTLILIIMFIQSFFFPINGIVFTINIIATFGTFLILTMKWNLFILRNCGFNPIAGLKKISRLLKSVWNDKSTKKGQFALIVSWTASFILFLAYFTISCGNPKIIRDPGILYTALPAALIPFSSFYITFNDTVDKFIMSETSTSGNA
jgi:hypothetical protein